MKVTAEEVARALGDATRLGDGGWKCRCPAHDDKKASLSVKDSRGKLLVRCHGTCTQEQVIDALRERDLWPQARSKATWTPVVPVPDGIADPKDVSHPSHGKPVRFWTYRDSDGKRTGYVFRFEDGKGGKTTIPMAWCESDDGRKAWVWKSFAKPRPLYNLHLLAKRPTSPVVVFEGEKSADAGTKRFPDHVCVAWPGGSKAGKYTDLSPLKTRDVSLWPDADEPGRKAMAQVAEILLTEGASKVKVVPVPEALDSIDQGWDVADEAPQGFEIDLDGWLASARPYEPVSEDMVEALNRRYAFVLLGGNGAVLRETHDYEANKTELSYLAVDAFKQFYCNVRVPVGRAMVPAGTHWMSHEDRRTFEGVTFAPNRTVPNYYNLWRGFSFDPDPTGDWSMFREHLLENAANGDKDQFHWILGWFAQMFQQPQDKVGTSLAFRGRQGTGKTVIGKIFGRLMHDHYTLIDNNRYLFGNFNSHMASTILLHSDEAFWGGDPKHVGQLRSMVTSDTYRVEYKRRDSVETPNYMRLLITTNQNWVVPAASEERRFAVFDMGQGREQDRSFFVEMLRQMRDGGYAGLLHHLMTFDLMSVDIGKIPDTAALRDQKETSMSDVAKFWYLCLIEADVMPGHGMGWAAEITATKLYDVMVEQVEKWGSRYRPTQTQFYKELKELCPPNSFIDLWRVRAGKQVRSVQVPDLEASRRFLDDLYGTQFDWSSPPLESSGQVSEEIPF